MRKWVIMLAICLLCGCSAGDQGMERALEARQRLLSAKGCSFSCRLSADYGQEVYTFDLQCTMDSEGALTFQLVEPESISGISGRVSAGEGALVFDDTVLALPPLAQGQLPPVRGPWILLNAFRSGYISSCSLQDSCLQLHIDDSYANSAVAVELWLEEDILVHGEIFWQNQKVLTLAVTDFRFL